MREGAGCINWSVFTALYSPGCINWNEFTLLLSLNFINWVVSISFLMTQVAFTEFCSCGWIGRVTFSWVPPLFCAVVGWIHRVLTSWLCSLCCDHVVIISCVVLYSPRSAQVSVFFSPCWIRYSDTVEREYSESVWILRLKIH